MPGVGTQVERGQGRAGLRRAFTGISRRFQCLIADISMKYMPFSEGRIKWMAAMAVDVRFAYSLRKAARCLTSADCIAGDMTFSRVELTFDRVFYGLSTLFLLPVVQPQFKYVAVPAGRLSAFRKANWVRG